MFAVFAAVLCLVSVIHSAPLACEELIRPLDQLEPRQLEGRWALVAGSLKDPEAEHRLRDRDSITIDLNNSTYTQGNRAGDLCQIYSHNISIEGHVLTLKVGAFNFTGTFLRTSCPDCMLMTWEVESPNYKSKEFYLFSRRRGVEQKEMEEFGAQVECLNMPPAVVMDPTKELCLEPSSSEPAAQTEEKTEGQSV